MFGLTEGGTPRAARAGKTRGVVLVKRAPRRSSWLAGWTQKTPTQARERRPAAAPPPVQSAPDRNLP